MKYCLIVVLMAFALPNMAQVVTDEEGFQSFISVENGDTFAMRQYFMVFLEDGPNRNQETTDAAKIQEGHMNHLNSLARAGKISIVGPFGDDASPRGIAIYTVPTLEEARTLAEMDPAVKAGRLKVTVRPFWAGRGSTLP